MFSESFFFLISCSFKLIGPSLIMKMAVDFGNLLKARRGKAVFYCFSEAIETLFSSIPDNTLNNALEYLSVETLPCNEEERLFFRKQLPHQTGPFSLIDERSLLRLHRYLLYCMQFQRNFPPRGYQSPLPSNLVPPSFSATL